MGAVTLGSTRLVASGRLAGLRVGVVANPASVDHAVRARRRSRCAPPTGVTLAAIFGPQHGFRSDLQDNMIETPHGRRRGAPGAGLLALQRDARADRRDARRPRRAGHRPAGRRRPHLHLHLHDGQLPARLRAGTACRSSSAIGRTRSAASTVEGETLVAGLRVVRRPLPDPDAPRHDDRRAGAALQRALRASAPTSRWSPMEGWRRDLYADDGRRAVGDAVAEHADARHGHRLSRHRAARRHAWPRRAAAPRGRSSWSARRGSTRERVRRRG